MNAYKKLIIIGLALVAMSLSQQTLAAGVKFVRLKNKVKVPQILATEYFAALNDMYNLSKGSSSFNAIVQLASYVANNGPRGSALFPQDPDIVKILQQYGFIDEQGVLRPYVYDIIQAATVGTGLATIRFEDPVK